MAKAVNDVELREKIANLRESLGLSKEEFSKKLQVHRSQLSRWEAGTEPPSNEKLIMLGNLADRALLSIDVASVSIERKKAIRRLGKYPDGHWFWERAGIDLDWIRKSISRIRIERDPSGDGKIVDVPRLDMAALSQFIKLGAMNAKPLATDLVPFPALFISDPASMICVQATDRLADSRCFVGDLCLVQLAAACDKTIADSNFKNLIDRAIAVFDENSLIVREESSAEADRLDGLRNSAEPAYDEVSLNIEPRTFFGTLRIQSHEKWDGEPERLRNGAPWRLVLNSGDTSSGLTPWSTLDFPSDGSWRCQLKPGVHILGSVIGWLRAPGADGRV